MHLLTSQSPASKCLHVFLSTCVALRSVLSNGPDNENWCCPCSTSSAKHTDTVQACLAFRGLLPQTAHAEVRCGLPLVINLTSTAPQTQWHAPANMHHMGENTSTCLKTLGALAAVIGTSCALSLKTDSGSVIEVTLSPASLSWSQKIGHFPAKQHVRGEMENVVIMFCLAETGYKYKNGTFGEEYLMFASALLLVIVLWAEFSWSAGEVNPNHRTVVFLSVTVQELSGFESVPFLSFYPRETAPAGAQEKRMKR